jgi:hypothetical protein
VLLKNYSEEDPNSLAWRALTGSQLNDPALSFKYLITATNQSVVDEGKVGLSGGFYGVKVDTARLSPGSYVFSLKALPYGVDSKTFTVSQTSQTKGGIKVTIIDGGGKPIVGASISSTSTPSGQAALSGVTGSDGSVTFNDVAAGSYTFQASLSGYVTNTGSMTIVAGGVATSSITLQTQSPGGASSGGIPGYGYEVIGAGIILSVVVLALSSRRQ